MRSSRTLKERMSQLLTDLRYGWTPLDDTSPRSDAEWVTKMVLGVAILGVMLGLAWCRFVVARTSSI